MTVADLINELLKLDLDSEVILQKDAEGNGYSPLSTVDGNAIYWSKATCTSILEWGEVFSLDWTAEDAGFDSEQEWEEFKKSNRRCCVLAPVN